MDVCHLAGEEESIHTHNLQPSRADLIPSAIVNTAQMTMHGVVICTGLSLCTGLRIIIIIYGTVLFMHSHSHIRMQTHIQTHTHTHLSL